MPEGTQEEWRDLCIAVTNESDSTKLSSLVQELIEALDKRERRSRRDIPPSDSIVTKGQIA